MTDPDGDRCGLAYLAQDGTYKTLTGNQSAAMLIDYLFSQRKEKDLLSKNGVMYNTIVTSALGAKIATYYGVKTEAFLTGFKFIGDRIDYYEKHGGPTFEFGYEESYGCLAAPFARDKDGIQAITLYSEMALYHHLHGKTLDMVWDDLGKRFGYVEDKCYSMTFEGSAGNQKMAELMDNLRKNPYISLLGHNVVKVEDYELSVRLEGNKKEVINLPKSNVIKLFFDDETTIAVRPSGTEPKVKFYIGITDKDPSKLDARVKEIYDALKKLLNL